MVHVEVLFAVLVPHSPQAPRSCVPGAPLFCPALEICHKTARATQRFQSFVPRTSRRKSPSPHVIHLGQTKVTPSLVANTAIHEQWDMHIRSMLTATVSACAPGNLLHGTTEQKGAKSRSKTYINQREIDDPLMLQQNATNQPTNEYMQA